MRITFDPTKRDKTLAELGLDFADAAHVFSMRKKPMNANKPASRRSLKSELSRVDAHHIESNEHDELPELTEDMLARATVKKGGRPVSANPRKLISLRLPADVIERWKATGPGWQTRMADRLSKAQEGPAGSNRFSG